MPLGHVLIIRPGALGDAVLTLPALAALHAAGAESLTVLGTPASWAFLRSDGTAPRVEDFGSSEWLGLFADGATLSDRAIEILKHTQTAVIYLSGETIALERRLASFGIGSIFVFAPPVAAPRSKEIDSRTCFDFEWKSVAPCHAARQLLDPLAHCIQREALDGALAPNRIERLGWMSLKREEDEKRRQYISEKACSKYCIALHPGSGGLKKCWPVKQFAKLAARLIDSAQYFPLVFIGPADPEVWCEFDSIMRANKNWHPILCWPLRDALALLHSCYFFIGNDSGLSHLAARATPVFSIFGPTNPNIWAPIGEKVRIVEAPGGDLNTLSVDDVFAAVSSLTPLS